MDKITKESEELERVLDVYSDTRLCPVCGEVVMVIQTLSRDPSLQIIRRRKCEACGHTKRTAEFDLKE